MSDQILHYRPARTVAAITGTVTVTTAPDGRQQVTRSSDVVLATEADSDPGYRWQVELKERHFGSDREFDLKLSPDERLAGATSTSTGIGPELLAAGIRIAALAGTIVAGFREPEPRNVEGIEAHFAADQPELAERRSRYREIVRQLDAELERLTAHVGQATAEQDTHLETVQAALTSASAELATINAAFNDWLEVNYPPWTRNYSYLIGTDELPVLDDATDRARFDALTSAAVEAAQAIGVVVARIADRAKGEPKPTDHPPAVWFRFPRRVTLAVYETVDPKTPSGEYRLRKIVPAWVVDRHSELGSVEIESHLFHNNGATVEFGDAGTLTHLANSQTSPLGALATTLGGAGQTISDAIDQGTKIAGVLKPKALDPDLRALQDQVTRKELEARLVKANRVISGGATTPTSDTG